MIKCSCGQDLSEFLSVRRTYVNKDDGPDLFGYGHYDSNGYFEPDTSIALNGRYDLVDGSDVCAKCGNLVG